MTQIAPHVDVAVGHPMAFVFTAVLVLIFGIGRVAKETKIAVRKWTSFLHLWMASYILLLEALMSLTTAIALTLLVNESGEPSVKLPPSFVSLAAALAGVFGFEFLFRKLVVGFGQTQFDLSTTLQNLVDQAVAATLRKEAGK